MNQIMHILAEEFVNAFIPQGAKAGWVAECAAAFDVNSIDGFGGRVEKQTEFILTLAQRHFNPLALRDVPHHTYHTQHPALLVEEGSCAFLQPHYRTIGTQHAIANLGSRVLGSKFFNRTAKQCAVVWMDSDQ